MRLVHCALCGHPRETRSDPTCKRCRSRIPAAMHESLHQAWRTRVRAHADWRERLAETLTWMRTN